ncbi:MAG: NADH-quinone oxidoreductase subunit M [Planctomycetota bacterium]|nr:NADH-quinone oxidoreductase subunit M [Planctomycetota bacterium]
MESNWLWILLLIPAAGALLCALLPVTASRGCAFVVSLFTLVVGVGLAMHFDLASRAIQLKFAPASFRLPAIGASFSLGIDSISLWLILLTVLLMPLAVAASFESIKDRAREYYSWMLLLLAAMLGVFVARDLLLFYVFFELTLVPMFFIIGIWGGPDRRFAAAKFFLFTFTGSVFTLAGAIYLGLHAQTFDINSIVSYAQHNLSDTQRHWVLLAFLAGFAVKVPLFPVHTWLPLAHTEAPTAGSVILAGVLLKLGTYGLLRFAVPIGFLDSSGVSGAQIGTIRVLATLCLIGIIYGALVAWVQQDIKKLVAYSSVSHLGFCVLGLLALNTWGVEGSVLYMVNHGLSTGALFLVIGMIYDRYHTRDINQLSGLAKRMPILAFFFVLFTLSSIGLPGLNGFVSEFLTILGAFTAPHLGATYGTFAALGIILGAIYMLHMVARVIWGPLKTPELHDDADSHGDHAAVPGDIGAREIAILVPLAIAVVWLGVYPNMILRSVGVQTPYLIGPYENVPMVDRQTKPASTVAVPAVAMADAARDSAR